MSGETQLERLLEYIESSTQAEVAVVTVPSLDNLSVEEYANKLFKRWGIGKKEQNNGVLLLIAPQERKVRIEVGYGLEAILTDGKCGRILDEKVLPTFREGEYAQGSINACVQIMAALLDTTETFGTPGPERLTGNPATLIEEAMPWPAKIGIMLFFSIFVTIGFLAFGSGLGKGGQSFFII